MDNNLKAYKPVPSVARIAHYVLQDGSHLACIITKVWSPTCVNLVVFTDNPFVRPENIGFPTSVNYNEEYLSGTWHWPERTEGN